MSDKETRAVYDAKAQDYAELTASAARAPDLLRFMDLLPKGGIVLDLGCGPGAHAATLADAGFETHAWDASEQMVALAAKAPNVHAKQATFDDLNAQTAYDGIWANFSLLHADPDKFDMHLVQISTALTSGGYFHIGMKTGTGTKRDPLGRRYTYVTKDDLTTRLKTSGFAPIEDRTGSDVGLDGVTADWVTILARKNNA